MIYVLWISNALKVLIKCLRMIPDLLLTNDTDVRQIKHLNETCHDDIVTKSLYAYDFCAL